MRPVARDTCPMNFMFLSTTLWEHADGAHTAPQLAREVARRGHRVTFMQPRAAVNSGGSPSIRIVGLNDLGLGDLAVERTWYGLGIESLDLVERNLMRLLPELQDGNEASIAIWFTPFDPFVRLLPLLRASGYRTIYFPQDDFSATALYSHHRHSAGAERYMVSNAETLVTISEPVARKLARSGREVSVIPNGINLDEFRSAADTGGTLPGVIRGQRTLGFWGYLSEDMVDPGFLEFVAKERPAWSINLIGTCNPTASRIDRLKNAPNIHFLGQVPHNRLYEYGRSFDACLIPAPENDLSKGRDPIKVYEYLAVYKPVVVSNMPQLQGMPFVRNASRPKDFLEEIEGALEQPVQKEIIDNYLREQTWERRVDDLMRIVSDLKETPRQGTPRDTRAEEWQTLVLPSFQEVDPGMDAYLNSIETDLEQTRAWARDLERQVKMMDHDLERFHRFPPVRMARAARRRLRGAARRQSNPKGNN